MKRKISFVILAGVVVLALVGCGGEVAVETPASEEVVVSEDVSEEAPSEDVSEEVSEEEEVLLAHDVYYFNDKQHDGNFDINESAILAEYRPLEEDYKSSTFGIINDRLEFIPYSFGRSDFYSNFSKGYAHMNFDGYYLVVDTEGNIVSDCPTDARYRILCGGDGYYLVERKVSGFDVNELSYLILSAETDTLTPLYEDCDELNFQYCGSGVLRLGPEIFINMENLHHYYTVRDYKYEPKFIGFTENDELIWLHTTSYEGEIYVTDANDNNTLIATTGGWGEAKYGDGLIYVTDRDSNTRFIDLEGNIVIDLSQYRIIDSEIGGQFIDGYAVLNISGKDGYSYLAIIDKSGNFTFDPIPCNSADIGGVGSFSNGHIIMRMDGEIVVLDCSGDITTVFSDPSGIELSELYYRDNMIFNRREVKFYDMTGEEYPITIKNEVSPEVSEDESESDYATLSDEERLALFEAYLAPCDISLNHTYYFLEEFELLIEERIELTAENAADYLQVVSLEDEEGYYLEIKEGYVVYPERVSVKYFYDGMPYDGECGLIGRGSTRIDKELSEAGTYIYDGNPTDGSFVFKHVEGAVVKINLPDERVYVVDRENSIIQVFDK